MLVPWDIWLLQSQQINNPGNWQQMKAEHLHFQLRSFFSLTQCFQSLLFFFFFCCRSDTYPKSPKAPIFCFECWRSSELVSLSWRVGHLFLSIKIRIPSFSSVQYSRLRRVAVMWQTHPWAACVVPWEYEWTHQRTSISAGSESRNMPGTSPLWSPFAVDHTTT